MIKIVQLIFIFLFTTFYCSVQASEIKGGIKGFNGETIKAVVYEDYFTFHKKTLDQAVIKDNRFELRFQNQQTLQVILIIGTKSTAIYVAPDTKYQIGLEYSEQKNEGRAFNQMLDLYFIAPETTPLNTAIKAFNDEFKRFMSANYQLFAIQRADQKVDQFVKLQSKKITTETSDFLKNYYQYALANLRDISGYSEAKIYTEFIADRELLYQHKEFMNFWTQHYKNNFDELTLSKKGLTVMKRLAFENDVEKAVQAIMEAKGFDTHQKAELYLLQGLFEVYHIERLKPDVILKLMNQLAQNSSYANHQLIAKNMIENLVRNSPNRQLESFSLTNLEGEKIEFSQFFDKLTYLNFWSAKSIPSLREMSIIKKLEEKYGEKLNIVSLCIDEQSSFKEACEQFDFNWKVFSVENKSDLIDNFDLRTLPSYFLIDAGGKIKQAHTKGPAEIEEQLYRMARDL